MSTPHDPSGDSPNRFDHTVRPYSPGSREADFRADEVSGTPRTPSFPDELVDLTLADAKARTEIQAEDRTLRDSNLEAWPPKLSTVSSSTRAEGLYTEVAAGRFQPRSWFMSEIGSIRSSGPFFCNYSGCKRKGAPFSTRSELRKHARSHVPVEERPYGCSLCSRRFNFPKDLNRHMETHGLFSKECHLCNKVFTRRSTLEKHLQTAHFAKRDISGALYSLNETRAVFPISDSGFGSRAVLSEDNVHSSAEEEAFAKRNIPRAPYLLDETQDVFPVTDGGYHTRAELSEDDVHSFSSQDNSSQSDVERAKSSVGGTFSLSKGSVTASKAYTQPTTIDSVPKPTTIDNHSDAQDIDADSVQTDGRDDGLSSELRAQFALLFASELSNNLEIVNNNQLEARVVANLIFEYASFLESRAEQPYQSSVSSFVRHRRHMIARNLYNNETDRPSKPDLPDLAEKLDLLWSKEASEHEPDIDLSALKEDEDQDVSSLYPDFGQAKSFLLDGIEFSWLTSRLTLASSMTVIGSDVFTQVRADILKACRGRKPGSLQLSLEWDPLAFLQDQYSDSNNLPSFADVICVVGVNGAADAAPCGEYVSQVWPTFGTETLRLIDQAVAEALRDQKVDVRQVTVRGALDLELQIAWQKSNEIHLNVYSDTLAYLVEFGEVITWLAAACRTSGQRNMLALCSPILRGMKGSTYVSFFLSPISSPEFETQGTNDALDAENCWQRLFNNTTIVSGYPILHRSAEEKGLRISLQMMATLACAYRATMYQGDLLLTGLCSLFVPILKTASSIVWHFLIYEDLSEISHNEARKRCPEIAAIDFAALSKMKHFVGWTRQSQSTIGMKVGAYDKIGYSGSGPPRPGFALEGINIGFSKGIELSTKLMPGKRDSRVLGAPGGHYGHLVSVAAGWNVLFYDRLERRAWLVDGTSAVLLLSRACLTSPQAPELDFDAAQAPHEQFTHLDCPSSTHLCARDVLLNKNNQKIVLYRDEETPFRFKDLVLQILEDLHEMRSHVSKPKDAWSFSLSSARLEGFEFADIISREKPICPRSTKLEDSGTEWLRLIAESGTIAILGSSFGVLIRPVMSGCKVEVDLPKGFDLLATPIARLKRIATKLGEVNEDSWNLLPGLYWNEPGKSFSEQCCGCVRGNPRASCADQITELHDQRRKQLKNKRRRVMDVFEKYPKGSIIIGSRSCLKKIGFTPRLSTAVQPDVSNVSDSGAEMGYSVSPDSSRS